MTRQIWYAASTGTVRIPHVLPVIISVVGLTCLMGNTALVAQVVHEAVFWISLGSVIRIEITYGTIREDIVTLPEEKCELKKQTHFQVLIRFFLIP